MKETLKRIFLVMFSSHFVLFQRRIDVMREMADVQCGFISPQNDLGKF